MKKTLITKEHISALSQQVNIFDLKKFIPSDKYKNKPNYFEKNYNQSTFDKVVDFMKSNAHKRVKYKEGFQYNIQEIYFDKLLEKILNKENVVYDKYYNPTDIEFSFFNQFVGKDISELEGVFWNYNFYNVKVFQKYGIVALSADEKNLISDLYSQNNDFYMGRVSSIRIDYLYKIKDKFLSIDLENKIEPFFNYIKASDYGKDKKFLTILCAYILLGAEREKIIELFEDNKDIINNKIVVTFLKKINEKSMPDIFSAISSYITEGEQQQKIYLGVEESPLEQKTFQIDLVKASQKHQLGEVTIVGSLSEVIYYVQRLDETFISYQNKKGNLFLVTCVGTARTISFVKNMYNELLNDKNTIKNKKNITFDFMEKKWEKFHLSEDIGMQENKVNKKTVSKI